MVGGIPTPLKNMNVSWDDYSQYMEKLFKKNVPNHQPDRYIIIYIPLYIYSIYLWGFSYVFRCFPRENYQGLSSWAPGRLSGPRPGLSVRLQALDTACMWRFYNPGYVISNG